MRKKHFCDKTVAAFNGNTERDHQVVRTTTFLKRSFFRKTATVGKNGPGRTSGAFPLTLTVFSDRLMEERIILEHSLGLDWVDEHWGNVLPLRFPEGKARVAQRG